MQLETAGTNRHELAAHRAVGCKIVPVWDEIENFAELKGEPNMIMVVGGDTNNGVETVMGTGNRFI